MKAAFTSLPEHVVTLSRDTGEVDAEGKPVKVSAPFTLRPYPAGFPQFIANVYPAPTTFVNAEPVEDKTKARTHELRTAIVLLARCLGDQIDAKAPVSGGTRAAWDDYAVAVLSEMTAANLVQGDIDALLAGMFLVNRGAGRLGKANL